MNNRMMERSGIVGETRNSGKTRKERVRMKTGYRMIVAVVGMLALAAGVACGGTTSWKTVGSGNWINSGNWDSGVPTSADLALINTNGTAVINAGDSAVADSLVIALDRFASNTGTVVMTGGSLTVASETNGVKTIGTFIQSGGTHTVTGNLMLGDRYHGGLGYNGIGYYTLSGSGALSVGGTLIVGNENASTFSQSGGSVTASNLAVGYTTGANIIIRLYQMTGGTLTVTNLYVGYNGGYASTTNRFELSGSAVVNAGSLRLANALSTSGIFIQNGATMAVSGDLTVGNAGNGSQTGYGYYGLSNGSVTVGGNLNVGQGHVGSFTNIGGTVATTGALNISPISMSSAAFSELSSYTQSNGSTTAGAILVGGTTYAAWANGALTLQGGSLYGTSLIVGGYGRGVFNQSGGVVTNTGNLTIGQGAHNGTGSNGKGTYNFTGGILNLAKGTTVTLGRDSDSPGAGSSGTWNLGDANGTGTINETGAGAGINLIVRYNNGANQSNNTGTVRGWGVIPFTGTLTQSGQVIADGYGTDRTLNLSSFASVANSIENTAGGTNGWFAVNRGKLALPPLTIAGGNSTNNWGEPNSDTAIDLVNSARIVLSNATAGSLSGALLATNRTDVPWGLRYQVGVWSFGGVTCTTATVTFRYDDAAAATLGIAESDLHLWQYNGSWWTNVEGTRDAVAKTITSKAVGSLAATMFFAVAPTPPPRGGVIELY
jgi:hypothetical protein